MARIMNPTNQIFYRRENKMKRTATLIFLLSLPIASFAQEGNHESIIMERTTSYHWNEASQPMIKEGNFSIVNVIKSVYLGETVTRQGGECFRTTTKLKGTTNMEIIFFFPNGDSKKVNQSIPNIEKSRNPTPCLKE